MFADSNKDQAENEYRNIKLKLKGPNRHSELQAVKALMAMSAQNNMVLPERRFVNLVGGDTSTASLSLQTNSGGGVQQNGTSNSDLISNNSQFDKEEAMDLSLSESPEPVYGLSITMTEEEFKELAKREGIKDVIGEPVCKLCGGLFSGPLGIALHMCPAMKRQTYKCEICGEDKWKTKANLHSHIKWCKKRLSMKTEQHESKQLYISK